MAQVTIYLEDEIEKKVKKAAKSQKVSQSKWIKSLIKEKISNAWPNSVTDLAGSWKDFPQSEELRKVKGKDSIREEI